MILFQYLPMIRLLHVSSYKQQENEVEWKDWLIYSLELI